MANNYYERGDRLNVYLAAELPEEMTGQQDTQRICGKCAWYTFLKLESICRRTGKEVAFFANRECFTTEKDTTMEENTNAQPVAETGTQVCKECGRTLPLEDFQRRRNGKIDTVCKACRAEKIRVSMATGKEKKKITEGVEIEQLCHYLAEFKMTGLALWGVMPEEEEDIDQVIKAEWTVPFCREIFSAAADLQRDGQNAVPILVERRLGSVGQKFVDDLGKAFASLAQECFEEDLPAEEPVEILKTADFSDDALLEELRRRGYKGTITKVQEVEI